MSDALRDQMRRDGLAGGDAHGPRQLLPYPPRFTQGHMEFIKQTLKLARQLMACFGEHHFTRRSVEQTYAGLVLQLLNAMAHCRLAKTNNFPGTAKTARPGDGDKDL